MKKLYWILGGIIAFMAASILWLLANSLDVNSPRFSLINRNVENRDYTQFSVSFGTLEDTYSSIGIVSTNATELSVYEWDLSTVFSTPKYTMYKVIGDKFVKSDVIVKIGSIDFRATTDGKIIDIVTTTNSLKIYYIDYSDHYVKTMIPQTLEPLINISNTVKISYNQITYNAVIDYIDYQVIDGMIEVRIIVDNLFLLPGSTVEVGLVIKSYPNAYYVPSAYIQTDLVGTYLYMLDGSSGNVTKKYVTIVSNLQYYSIITIEPFYLSKLFVNYND
jgi:hypothetical protein